MAAQTELAFYYCEFFSDSEVVIQHPAGLFPEDSGRDQQPNWRAKSIQATE